MISHSSIAPSIITNNNTCNQPVNSLEPLNYLNLPIEMHHKILRFCTVNTLLSLRKTARKFYDIITPEIMKSKIYQENIPSHSTLYSISCYENFIAPILNHLNPQSKKNISKYLAQTKNKDSSFKKVSHFIGGEIVMMNHQFKKHIFTTKNINLDRNYSFHLFAMSKLSNNCAFSTTDGQVFLYSFSINNTLEKVAKFDSNETQESLSQLEFSPKNNLIVITNGNELILWKLNLNADPLIKNEILWKLNLNNLYNKIIMFQNEQQFICSSDKGNSIWKFDDQHQIASKQPIEEFLNIDNNNNNHIISIVISSNNNCIALLASIGYLGSICLFSRVNNQTQFIQDSIPKDIHNTGGRAFNEIYDSSLQLNAKGNICVYFNHYNSLILLNKFNDTWHNILYLNNAVYLSVELSPYNTHLFSMIFLNLQLILKTISFKDISLNSMTSDDDKRQINNDKLKYNNDYLLENYLPPNITYKIHPTGLAIALFNNHEQTLKLYYLKK